MNKNIYVPQWYVEGFLINLREHIIEGDVTRNQLIGAINNILNEIENAEVTVVKEDETTT